MERSLVVVPEIHPSKMILVGMFHRDILGSYYLINSDYLRRIRSSVGVAVSSLQMGKLASYFYSFTQNKYILKKLCWPISNYDYDYKIQSLQ